MASLNQTLTKEHDWKLMTMTDVMVLGLDPRTQEPIGLATGETREGINCGSCGIPWFPETNDSLCPEK